MSGSYMAHALEPILVAEPPHSISQIMTSLADGGLWMSSPLDPLLVLLPLLASARQQVQILLPLLLSIENIQQQSCHQQSCHQHIL